MISPRSPQTASPPSSSSDDQGIIHHVLLSFVGNQDPHATRLGGKTPGPILTLCAERCFHTVFLFHIQGEDNSQRARETASALVSLGKVLKPVITPLPIEDPSSHEQILAALRNWWRNQKKSSTEEYFVSISSGTPAMHAAWLLLAASDEIHANILHIRERRFADGDQPLIKEINPRAPEFPQVLPRVSLAVVPGPVAVDAMAPPPATGLIGNSATFRDCMDKALKYAAHDYPVLLLGETGTGKERVAELIHRSSKRERGPFVAINCGALPANLVESLLFGHKKGSFTGADRDQPGAFEEAHGGTLFLDEIGDMPLEMQVKLNRVIQERKIRPVGGAEEKIVDVRIVAATLCDLAARQKEGSFREDLHNRLNVLWLKLPPLRERREDIPALAQAFLEEANQENGASKRFSDAALAKLREASWPGNIRELENVVKRSFVLALDELIDADDLIFSESAMSGPEAEEAPLPEFHEGFSLKEYIDRLRGLLYRKALKKANGNQSEAGRLLGVSPESVRKEIAKGVLPPLAPKK